MSAVLKVFEKVHFLYKDKFVPNSTEEFVEGFKKCLTLFLVGIKSEDDYNLNYRIRELEKESNEKRLIIKCQKEEIIKLRKQINNTSFISGIPLDIFKWYELSNLINDEGITLVVNMDKETFMMFWVNFKSVYTWYKIDECKSKLISFINKYEAQGFKAYKDLKTARKQGIRI